MAILYWSPYGSTMLMRYLDPGLFARDPVGFFANLLFGLGTLGVAMLVGITVHEFSHALVANYLGDSTAKRQGRLSLNPLVHLDPVGTLMILLVGFGWGRPVPVNPYSLSGGMTRGMALVSFAGPLSNVIVAALVAILVRFQLFGSHSPLGFLFLAGQGGVDRFLIELVGYLIMINLVLAVFNLIPIAPLDGFKIALGVLPRELSISLARTEQYGMGLLLMIFAFDYFFDVGIIGRTLGPLVSGLFRLLVGG